MSFRELLVDCQAKRSQGEFATLLGISQAHLSRLLSGERKAGKIVVQALLSLFPGRRDEILALFFESEYDETHETMREGLSE